MRKGIDAHPQDKSEYQLPPPHLNILVPQDKLDVIMHPPSGQKKPLPPTLPEDNSLAIVDAFVKFKERGFIPPKRPRHPDHAHFGGGGLNAVLLSLE